MKILYSPRQGGKTTRMVEWLREEQSRMLVTFSDKEARRLVELYPDLVNRIVTWREYVERRSFAWNKHPSKIAIDNADIILQMLCRDEIDVITISNEEYV